MVAQIDRTTARGTRDAAIILLGFASALRRSELADLTLADIELKPEGLLIRVRKSKTDPEAHGQLVGSPTANVPRPTPSPRSTPGSPAAAPCPASKRDQGLIAAFRAKANRDRARIAEEDQKARAAERRRQSDAEAEDRQRRREERERERAAQLEAQRVADRAERDRQAAQEAEEAAERARMLAERQAEREQLLTAATAEVQQRFLGAADWLESNDPDGLVSADEFQQIQIDHVTDWWRTNLSMPNGKPFDPDPEQALVIATSSHHALVSARAGSGKTATMVGRPRSIPHPGVRRRSEHDPHAGVQRGRHRRDARPARETGAPGMRPARDDLPRARPPDRSPSREPAVRPIGLNAVSQPLRTGRPRRTDAKAGAEELVRDVMLAYFRRDWSRIVERGDNLSAADQVAYRRHLQDVSIKGDFVKSYGEKVIANVLFTNGIAGDGRTPESYYGYEHDVRWNGRTTSPTSRSTTRPSSAASSSSTSASKVNPTTTRRARPSVSSGPSETKSSWSTSRATSCGPTSETGCSPTSAMPVRRCNVSATKSCGTESRSARSTDSPTQPPIIGRALQRRWNGEHLRVAWANMGIGDPDLDRFIDLSADLLDAYAASITDDRKEDFTGLMWRAVDEVCDGTTSFGRGGRVDGDVTTLRHIVVDEFQDFSMMFFELLQASLSLTPDCRVMAVGDDWQAINEFAGSTSAYFTSFETEFENASRLTLVSNRRSAATLVKLGNSVMRGRGSPTRAVRTDQGLVREFKADLFDPSPTELSAFGEYDLQTPALLRLIQQHRASGRTVAVLSRKRRGTWVVNLNGGARSFTEFAQYGGHLRNILDIDEPAEVRFSSTHGSKGQEADAVIMLDVT